VGKLRSIVELKNKNLLDILKVIQIHGPISKPDIAIRSQVSTVTAHNFIIELESAGLVVSNGIAKSNGGRKAVLYSINPNYGYIIALNHGRLKITTNVYDLSLNTLHSGRAKAELGKSTVSIENMKKEIQSAIQASGVAKEKILGIGITLPGQVNHRDGVVNSMLNLREWDNTPLQSIMERYLALPVCVYNDNRANIISCKWLNKISETACAVYVNIHDGVGVGVMVNGEVFSGSHSFAGELGHLTVRGNKAKCFCGKIGCIETLICTANVIRQIKKKRGITSVGDNSTKAYIQEIVRLARHDRAVYEIIREAVGHIGFLIDAIIKSYDPEKITIYNPWLLHFNEMYGELIETVFGNCSWLKKNTLAIDLDTDDVIDGYGPLSVVLENLFNYNSENRIVLKMD